MEIKRIHAHFLVSTGNYCNERVGFTVEMHEDETVEQVVAQLREQAIKIIGANADTLYHRKRDYEAACDKLERKLATLKHQWSATAEFLRAQGINSEAPEIPLFENLLVGVKPEEESVTAEFEEDFYEEEQDEDIYE
jgi:hypothetical protein